MSRTARRTHRITRTRQWIGAAACACAVLLLSACNTPNPLRSEPSPEPALSPTRTVAPQPAQAEAASAAATSTSRPEPTRESSEPTRSADQSTPAATPRAVATRYELCSNVKPALTKITPSLNTTSGTTSGQIVYVTTDNNIVLTDLTGRPRVDITTDAFISQTNGSGRIYQFPTFSNDGKSVAFVSIAGDASGITQTVHVAPASTGATLTDLFSTNDYNIPYLDWSPDSNQVAFLTISRRDGAIRVVNKGGGDVSVFDTGSPTYWHWRFDSAAMITHLGGRAASKGLANVSVIEASGAVKGDQVIVEELPGSFQSPHFSPDGQHLLFVANTGQTDELVLADGNGKPICTLGPVADNAYFAWSPNGAYVAVMDTLAPLTNPSDLIVFDLIAGTNKTVHDNASTFFWSPDGARLAVYSVVPDATLTPLGIGSNKLSAPVAQTRSPALRIEIVDAETGKTFRVADTYPSPAFLQYLQFFDQYSRAVTPWSPDGKHIVFSSVSPTRENADVAVATLNATQTGVNLSRVAAGTVAFWSPK